MKRALIIGTGTVMGVAAVLALNPDGGAAASGNLPNIGSPSTSGATTAGTATSAGSATTAGSTTNAGSTGTAGSNSSSNAASSPNSGSSSNSGAASSSSSKTATGSAVDVGYGIVQVKAIIKAGKLVDVQALSLPNNDGHSARISQQAFPMLVEQAIAAQSANVSGIGGASYTSYGFQQSLSSALSKAGFKG
jgi:uncharacterized protein with FMN-binding domain